MPADCPAPNPDTGSEPSPVTSTVEGPAEASPWFLITTSACESAATTRSGFGHLNAPLRMLFFSSDSFTSPWASAFAVMSPGWQSNSNDAVSPGWSGSTRKKPSPSVSVEGPAGPSPRLETETLLLVRSLTTRSGSGHVNGPRVRLLLSSFDSLISATAS